MISVCSLVVRNGSLREIVSASEICYRQEFIGQSLDVLWESTNALGPGGWEMSGLTDNYLRVEAEAAGPNRVEPVRITGLTEEGLAGERLNKLPSR